MPESRTWAIKGVSDRTRDAAVEAAHAAGLTVGEWVDQALAKAAEEAQSPRPPSATREDVAEVVRELLTEQLTPIAERLTTLEKKTDRETRPEPAGTVAAPPPEMQEISGPTGESLAPDVMRRKTMGRPRRELPEDVRARIEELHGAGRSMYAISKELGLPYNVVYSYVKRSLGQRREN